MPTSAVLIPFFVLCGFLALTGVLLVAAVAKSRRPRSPMRADAAARGWTYADVDPDVTAGLGPATHVVRGRHRDLLVLGYQQFPAPGQRFSVTEVSLDRAWPALAATPVGALTEAFAVGGTPVPGLLDGYVVTCPDEEFARAVLVGSVRRTLQGSALLVRDRRLVVVQDGAQSPDGLDAALAVAMAVAERVAQYR